MEQLSWNCSSSSSFSPPCSFPSLHICTVYCSCYGLTSELCLLQGWLADWPFLADWETASSLVEEQQGKKRFMSWLAYSPAALLDQPALAWSVPVSWVYSSCRRRLALQQRSKKLHLNYKQKNTKDTRMLYIMVHNFYGKPKLREGRKETYTSILMGRLHNFCRPAVSNLSFHSMLVATTNILSASNCLND